MAADRRAYYLAHRERLLAAAKARYEAKKQDPEWREKVNAANRARDAANPEAKKEAGRKYREKVKTTPALLERQRAKDRVHQRLRYRRASGIINATAELRFGACRICLRENVKLVCDHEHGQDGGGPIRGWICCRCNRGLGNLGDTCASVGRAYEYLREHQENCLSSQPEVCYALGISPE